MLFVVNRWCDICIIIFTVKCSSPSPRPAENPQYPRWSQIIIYDLPPPPSLLQGTTTGSWGCRNHFLPISLIGNLIYLLTAAAVYTVTIMEQVSPSHPPVQTVTIISSYPSCNGLGYHGILVRQLPSWATAILIQKCSGLREGFIRKKKKSCEFSQLGGGIIPKCWHFHNFFFHVLIHPYLQ